PGELVLFGAYVSWATILHMRQPLYIALPLTLVIAVLLGLVIERGVLRPLIGQPIISVIMVTFGVASVIRGLLNMTWGSDTRAYPVVILGGLDSVAGAIIGGVLIGVLENLSGGYLDPILGGGVKEVAPFVALVIILMIRPYGLFGKVEIERV